MTISTLSYHLSHQFVHNWLVAGPKVKLVPELSSFPKDNLEISILQHNYSPESGVTREPVDIGPLNDTDDPEVICWRYYSCLDDHYIDFTSFSTQCAYQQAWAFSYLNVTQDCQVDFCLTTNGPADLWLNDEHVHRQEHFSKQSPIGVSFKVTLKSGMNKLLIRIENVAIREAPFVMAFRIDGLPDNETMTLIPTNIEKDYIQTRIDMEKVIQCGYLDKYVYGWMGGDEYEKNEPITVRFTSDLKVSPPIALAYRLQSLKGDIFQEGNKDTNAATVYELAKNFPLRNGPHHLALIPEAGLYYIKKIRLDRRDMFYVVRNAYSNHMYSILHERRHEAMEDAAKRKGNNLYIEIAKMVLGQWSKVDKSVLKKAFEHINQRHEGSIVELIGLIGVLLQFKRKPDFPKELRSEIEDNLLEYRYWEDEPGDDIMDFQTESRQLLFHTCEILAGQLFMDKTFKNSGQTGKWHREKGELLITKWLNDHGSFGWEDWDSPEGFEEELAGLSYLIDYASNYSVSELASVMMDKILFSLAVNSYNGSFGTTHGRTSTAGLLSSRLEATSGITRLMWGMGNYNEHLFGTVSLAGMKKYDFPNLIRNIATRSQNGLWDRERHGRSSDQTGQATDPGKVNKVTYKTNDYILSSAQDYNSFSKGNQEHIWQATLGPDSVVFVNHPACMSQDDAHIPNFWKGNAQLPRVVQWGDVLVSQYNLPDDDWLGFTHAYFPTATFDEYVISGPWAFARKNNGYLALYSKLGLELVGRGQSAFRELRAYGKENIWICHMGQALLDGTFENFQEKIKALEIQTEGSILIHNLRGDTISVDPDSHLMVNGQAQDIKGFRHYESPYCIADFPADEMIIGFKDQGMKLSFNEE
jgi:hypothetical protein